MIAYFDASAVVPLLVTEPGTVVARQIHDEADQVVSVRVFYPEVRAALGQAHRSGRITTAQLRHAKEDLTDLSRHAEIVEVDSAVAELAGDLAELYALRGYDAIHLAAATSVPGLDLFVAGDRALIRAARTEGIPVVDLAA